jgi:hypothetical protein
LRLRLTADRVEAPFSSEDKVSNPREENLPIPRRYTA